MSTCYTVLQNIINESREMNTRDYITLLRIKNRNHKIGATIMQYNKTLLIVDIEFNIIIYLHNRYTPEYFT